MLEYRLQGSALRGPRTLSPEETPKGLVKPLPWGSLPVDSHDVARMIDDEVIQKGVQFSRIDYQLCWRDKSPEPLWMATLVGSKGETLGHMFVSSMSGQVTHRAFYFDFPRLPLATKSESGKPGQGQASAASATTPANSAASNTKKSTGLGLFRKRTNTPPPAFKRQ